MKRKLTLVATAIALVVLAGSGYLALQISGGVPIIGNPLGIALARPAVVQGEGSFLEDEAGITAYTDTGFTIDLDNARDAFRTVEQETANYLIGSVAVPGFPDTEDVHVHHIEDFSTNPDRELDPTNLITLRRDIHLLFGHLGNYRSINPDIIEDAKVWKVKLEGRR